MEVKNFTLPLDARSYYFVPEFKRLVILDLICIVFIGSPIETAVNLFGFTFQGYPLNLDMCK